MSDLVILCPTVRPDNAERLYNAFHQTSSADTQLVFVVDAGKRHSFRRLFNLSGCEVWEAPPNLRRGMVAPTNWAWGVLNEADEGFGKERHGPEFRQGFRRGDSGGDPGDSLCPPERERHSAVGFLGDDVIPRTSGWDTQLLESLRSLGGTGLVYGNDLLQGERIATHPIVSWNIPATLGWLALPTLDHLCVDVVLHRLAMDVGRCKYRGDVVLEHLHPANGKAKSDSSYHYVNRIESQARDGTAMTEYLSSPEYQRDLERIRSLM